MNIQLTQEIDAKQAKVFIDEFVEKEKTLKEEISELKKEAVDNLYKKVMEQIEPYQELIKAMDLTVYIKLHGMYDHDTITLSGLEKMDHDDFCLWVSKFTVFLQQDESIEFVEKSHIEAIGDKKRQLDKWQSDYKENKDKMLMYAAAKMLSE